MTELKENEDDIRNVTNDDVVDEGEESERLQLHLEESKENTISFFLLY